MSFIHATYLKAQAALDAGDEARAMKLIRRPVDRRQTRARDQLQRLIHAAARAGLGQVAEQWVTLLPPEWQHQAALGVWALAVEAGHEAVAARWRQTHAKDFSSWGEVYAEALVRDAWKALVVLLDHNSQMDEGRANWTLRHMHQKYMEPVTEAGAEVVRRVVPHAEEARWWMVAALAMRADDQALLDQMLAPDVTTRPQRRMQAEDLWKEAFGLQRLDWLAQVEQRLAFEPRVSVVAQQLDIAIQQGHPGFAMDFFIRRPEVLDRLQQPLHQHDWWKVARAVLTQVAAQQLVGAPEHRPLWEHLTSHRSPQNLRRHLEITQGLDDGPQREALLNALAVLVPNDVARDWFAAEPERFARATPYCREEQAQAAGPETPTRRIRHRA